MHYIALVVLPPEYGEGCDKAEAQRVAHSILNVYSESTPHKPKRVLVSAAERSHRYERMSTANPPYRMTARPDLTEREAVATYVGGDPDDYYEDAYGAMWTTGGPSVPLHDYIGALGDGVVALSDAEAFASENYGGFSYIVSYDGVYAGRLRPSEVQPQESIYYLGLPLDDDLRDLLDRQWAELRTRILAGYPEGSVAVFFDTHR